MLKTILKVLIFYAILSAMVSGCSLIGDYAEGFEGIASNDTPIKTERETTKEHNEDTKTPYTFKQKFSIGGNRK